MPFKSKAQQRFMFAKHPKMAEEFAKATPDIKALPEHLAYGGETNPKKETLTAMQNNPTAGFADGGEAFNAPKGDWEAIKAQLLKNTGPNPGEPGIQDATMGDFVAPMVGGMAAKAMMPEAMGALQGLGEAGEVTLGNAPKFEGEFPDVVRYTKGVMGKGTPNEMRIESVKGPVEQIRKFGYGDDPGSIPSHILDKFGIPEEAPSVDMGGQSSPNGYSDGGLVEGLKRLIQGDKTETKKADDIDPVITSSDTAKGYADGGDVMPQPFPAGGYPGAGTDNANSLLDMIKTMGLRSMLPGSDTMNNMASGIGQAVTDPGTAGVVNNALGTNVQNPQPPPQGDPAFMAKLQAGTAMSPTPSPAPQPQQPGLSQVAQNAQNMPPTDYSLFKGISADDRANLYKQLLQKQAGGGSAAISGLAGIGDAISRSFGHQNTNYQKDVRENQEKNMQNQLGAVDTQRQQKLEDISGNQEMALADPQSALSQSIRKTLQSAGLRVPSNMPGNMMLKISGPLGELAMKQATLEETKNYHKGELGQQANALQNKEETYASEHPILNFLNPVNNQHPTSPVSNTNLTGGAPQMGQMFNNEKIIGVKRIR